MEETIIAIIMGVLTFLSMIFSFILSTNKNEIWENIRERM